MKSDVHPEYNPVVFKDGEHEIVTRSTATSENTREIDGVEHYVINVDISAFTHPFYTGQKKLVDTEGRVDRFKKRYNIQDDDDGDDEAEAQESDDEAEAQESDDEAEAQESDDEASSEKDSSDTDGQEAAGEEETEEATEEAEDGDTEGQNEVENEDEDEEEDT